MNANVNDTQTAMSQTGKSWADLDEEDDANNTIGALDGLTIADAAAQPVPAPATAPATAPAPPAAPAAPAPPAAPALPAAPAAADHTVGSGSTPPAPAVNTTARYTATGVHDNADNFRVGY